MWTLILHILIFVYILWHHWSGIYSKCLIKVVFAIYFCCLVILSSFCFYNSVPLAYGLVIDVISLYETFMFCFIRNANGNEKVIVANHNIFCVKVRKPVRENRNNKQIYKESETRELDSAYVYICIYKEYAYLCILW